MGPDGRVGASRARRSLGRAHEVLRAVEDPRLAVLHAPTPFDSRYMAHREDVAVDMALLRLRWHGRR